MGSAQHSHASEAVDAFNGGVVPNEKARREMLNRSAIPLWHAANGEQELKLLRFHSNGPRRFLAIRHEQPNLVAELREGSIIVFREP